VGILAASYYWKTLCVNLNVEMKIVLNFFQTRHALLNAQKDAMNTFEVTVYVTLNVIMKSVCLILVIANVRLAVMMKSLLNQNVLKMTLAIMRAASLNVDLVETVIVDALFICLEIIPVRISVMLKNVTSIMAIVGVHLGAVLCSKRVNGLE
jgi:hypothetical protein